MQSEKLGLSLADQYTAILSMADTEILPGRTSAPRHFAMGSVTSWFGTIAGVSVFLLGIAEALFYAFDHRNGPATLIEIALGTLSCLVILLGSRKNRFRLPFRAWMLPVIAVLIAITLAYAGPVAWPDSGDEYGYLYLARTLLHSRVTNPAPPVPGLFDFYHIGLHDGRSMSQYAPGWPAFLAMFQGLGWTGLANPALVAVLGFLIVLSLRALGTAPWLTSVLTAFILISPFTLFNGASLFSHLQAAVATMGVCYFQIRDEASPHAGNKVAVGALLSIALVTRQEVFFILVLLFLADRLFARRLALARDASFYAIGGLPLGGLWLVYNWAVTGNPFMPTMLWVAADDQSFFGFVGFYHLLAGTSHSIGALWAFSSPALMVLYAFALASRVASRTLRFYDLLLPAAVLLFMFYQEDAGHEYGPRYWYFAWPTAVLTIGAAFLPENGWIQLWRLRVHLPTMAGLQCVAYLGFTIAFAAVLHSYVQARRVVYMTPIPKKPAIVLVPERELHVLSLRPSTVRACSKDFTRNDFEFSQLVLYGRGDEAKFYKLACSLPGRSVYVWRSPERVQPVSCDPGSAPPLKLSPPICQ